ncbi:hypothetical protein GXB78_05665 [Pseudomonas moraviensis subsp. stanleyae]|uniref:hypothetical protein n=1 Tax=Pseudomonas moraviensis TaxID=321662 RepID=UPI002E304939|nr:hypothetical protein [Pseudomonas moraviensis]MED7666693.1 hypothetical protein [Pseudomonas moraviensis subsp. stanleyae]
MNAVGLTHGSFYNQLESKAELKVLALQHAFYSIDVLFKESAEQEPGAVLSAVVANYLSDSHAKSGSMCALATLAIDSNREERTVRAAYSEGVRMF